MNNIRIYILVKNTDSIETIESLQKQNFQNISVFLMNNSVKDINKIIGKDSRFVVPDTSLNEQDIIHHINDGYVIIANSGDIFVPNALEYIARTIYLTNADIINFSSKNINKYLHQTTHKIFRYIFQNKIIMNHVFDYPSCFCVKSEYIKQFNFDSWSHLTIIDILKNAKDMDTSNAVYILVSKKYTLTQKTQEYRNIVDYYTNNKKSLSPAFWKQYFSYLIPNIVHDTISNNDKQTFVYCAKHIDCKFIPLKYKFMFFIMKHMG